MGHSQDSGFHRERTFWARRTGDIETPAYRQAVWLFVAAALVGLFSIRPALALMLSALLGIAMGATFGTAAAAAVALAAYPAFPPYLGIEVMGTIVIFWQRVILYGLAMWVIATLVFQMSLRRAAMSATRDQTTRRALVIVAFLCAARLGAEVVARDGRGMIAATNEILIFYGSKKN